MRHGASRFRRRGGTPEDVAKVALFLASDLSSYVGTGDPMLRRDELLKGIRRRTVS